MNKDLQFGALAPTLEEQLQDHLKPEKAKRLNEQAWCITHLSIQGLLTDKEAEKARQRLIKKIKRNLKNEGGEG